MQLITVGPNGNEHAEIGRSWHAYSYSQLIPVGLNRNEDAEMEILASLFLFAATVGPNGNEHAEMEILASLFLFTTTHSNRNEDAEKRDLGMPIPIRQNSFLLGRMGMSMLKGRSWHAYSYSVPNGNEHAEIERSWHTYSFSPKCWAEWE